MDRHKLTENSLTDNDAAMLCFCPTTLAIRNYDQPIRTKRNFHLHGRS